MGNLLCIDNSETIRMIVKDVAKELNIDFFEASNEKKALDLMEEVTDLDVIVLDYNTSKQKGKEFIEACKSNSKLKGVKVFTLLNFEQKHHAIETLDYGADTYMIKPFNVTEFSERLQKLMKDAD